MRKRRVVLVAAACVALAAGPARGELVSVKLTSNALGLGSNDLNAGSVVSPDIPGKLYTSPVVGQGSILNIQLSGLAGPGSPTDPLWATVTARSHLDTLTGLPAQHDYHAAVLYVSRENTAAPDGKDEGLGVRAFTVVGATGLRAIDSKTKRARIEGSKEVSGGTGPTAYRSDKPNGAPHVDESVTFTFNPAVYTLAQTTEVVLSKFVATDKLDLLVELTSGQLIERSFLGTANPSILQPISAKDNLWVLQFAGIVGIGPGDFLRSFAIRAVEDNPKSPSGTAEHFLISGFSAQLGSPPDEPVVPEPFSATLLGIGGLMVAWAGRKRVRRRGALSRQGD